MRIFKRKLYNKLLDWKTNWLPMGDTITSKQAH